MFWCVLVFHFLRGGAVFWCFGISLFPLGRKGGVFGVLVFHFLLGNSERWCLGVFGVSFFPGEVALWCFGVLQ